MPFRGETTIVFMTGASSGIGRPTAHALSGGWDTAAAGLARRRWLAQAGVEAQPGDHAQTRREVA